MGPCTPGATVVPPTTTLMSVPPTINLSCNFDSFNFCNWKLDPKNPWVLNIINAPLQPMMPTIDHSRQNANGGYIYVIHNSNDVVPKKQAIMTAIDKFDYNGSICVSLWYYMRTDSMAQLILTTSSPDNVNLLQVRRFNDHGEKWNLLRFDVDGVSNGYQFNISAMVISGIKLYNLIVLIPKVLKCFFLIRCCCDR